MDDWTAVIEVSVSFLAESAEHARDEAESIADSISDRPDVYSASVESIEKD